MNYFLKDFPEPEELKRKLAGINFPEYREANGHIHTPFSFSAFPDLDTVFRSAVNENIAVLGINDFFVTDGYEPFCQGALKNRIFPLFNIEFIGLLKESQKTGVRINDPNNPGRIYFSGKGLDYPFNPGFFNRIRINRIKYESQVQMKAMIARLNDLVRAYNPNLSITYEIIKAKYAHELVRERHLAKAIRHLAEDTYPDQDKQLQFIESLYGGKKSRADSGNPAAFENEIRSNLLKKGGPAFVEENESSFLPVTSLIKIILRSGGIPCYPVLLDDPAGNYTEFERDPEKLHRSLTSLKVGCIELMPGRNDLAILREFVEYFDSKDYIITFGTEHNTPEMAPLTVSSRNLVPLDQELKEIGWEGVCIIAGHQYLRAKGRQGYILNDGNPSKSQKKQLASLGQMVIEYFLQNHSVNEKGVK